MGEGNIAIHDRGNARYKICLLIGLVLIPGLSRVREKTELIEQLRPAVESVQTTTEEAIHGEEQPCSSPCQSTLFGTCALREVVSGPQENCF
jgi:hypothetical protein